MDTGPLEWEVEGRRQRRRARVELLPDDDTESGLRSI